MLLHKYLLYFLGLYSWSFKSSTNTEKFFLKKYINLKLLDPIKNNKKLISLYEVNSNSPEQSSINILFSETSLLKYLDKNTKYKIFIYNIYSLCIFILLCIQPIYLLINFLLNTNNNFDKYLLLLLINIITPINYIWSKYYFNTNHLDLFISDSKFNCSYYIYLILIVTIISIIVNLFHIDIFYNEFYYISYFNKPLAILIIIFEWLYSRLIHCLILISFIIVFCKHIKNLKSLINDICINEINLEDSYCLTILIKKISMLRNSIECSIQFYNKLLSFITIMGGISIAIFFKQLYHKFQQTRIIVLQNYEYYIIQAYIFYTLCQLIFFCIVLNYTKYRNKLIKLMRGPSFVNRFLTRWSTTKMKRKCKDNNEIKHYCKMMLVIQQENATSIDWLILEKLCSSTWINFSILGITSQDGSLIKKVIAFSSIIYVVLSYL